MKNSIATNNKKKKREENINGLPFRTRYVFWMCKRFLLCSKMHILRRFRESAHDFTWKLITTLNTETVNVFMVYTYNEYVNNIYDIYTSFNRFQPCALRFRCSGLTTGNSGVRHSKIIVRKLYVKLQARCLLLDGSTQWFFSFSLCEHCKPTCRYVRAEL